MAVGSNFALPDAQGDDDAGREHLQSHHRCLRKGRPGERRKTFLNLFPEARVVLNEFIYSATISACKKGGQSIWH